MTYNAQDVIRSHQWLGHTLQTELVALHPGYRKGREHYDWNRANRTFPVTRYADSPKRSCPSCSSTPAGGWSA